MENIIEIIRRQMEKQGMSGAELARKITVKQPTVFSMLQRRNIEVRRLFAVSKAMEYNFFREISQQLPYKNPVYDAEIQQVKEELNQEITGLKQQITQLTEENKILKVENNLFREVIEKVSK